MKIEPIPLREQRVEVQTENDETRRHSVWNIGFKERDYVMVALSCRLPIDLNDDIVLDAALATQRCLLEEFGILVNVCVA